jgi:hypothetical protein
MRQQAAAMKTQFDSAHTRKREGDYIDQTKEQINEIRDKQPEQRQEQQQQAKARSKRK